MTHRNGRDIWHPAQGAWLPCRSGCFRIRKQETGTNPTPAPKGKRFPAGRLFTQDRTAPHTGVVPEPTGSRFSERHPGGADLRSAGEETRKRPVGSYGGSTRDFPSRRIFRVGGFFESRRLAIRAPGNLAAARRGGGALRRCAAQPQSTGLWRPAPAAGVLRSESESTCSPTVNVRTREAMTE